VYLLHLTSLSFAMVPTSARIAIDPTLGIRPPGASATQKALAGRCGAVEGALAFRKHIRRAVGPLLLGCLALAGLALLLRILQLQRQLPPGLLQLCCEG